MRIVQLGSRCNNACIFCAQTSEREQHLPEPSGEALLATVAEVASGGGVVAFVGGEPTLYESLQELVAHARRAGAARVIVQTNARRLAYASYARTLADGVDAIDVSLLGSSEAMHDYHTQVKGSFVQTIRGMSNARKAGISVVSSVVVTRSNYRNLHEIVRMANAAGAVSLRLRAPRVSGRAVFLRSRIVPHFELVAPYLRVAAQTARQVGIEVVFDRAEDRGSDFVDYLADRIEDSPLGEVEREQAAAACKAKPARHERRDRSHRTGQELREILPLLFEPSGGGR